jgi:hypothetical protein
MERETERTEGRDGEGKKQGETWRERKSEGGGWREPYARRSRDS